MVSKNIKQPLDLTTNNAMKKMKNRAFSEYFIDCTTRVSLKDPEKIVTTIDADLKTVHFTAETRKKNISDKRTSEIWEKTKNNFVRLESSCHYQKLLKRVVLG